MEEERQFYHPDEEATVQWPDNIEISQLCRICANTSEYLIPIFDGEGMENELELKIKKHLPIQVSKTDTLPMNLCYQCASTLIAWHDLTLGCIEADKRLRDLVNCREERSLQSKNVDCDGSESARGVGDIEIEFEEEVTTTPSTSTQVEVLESTSTSDKLLPTSDKHEDVKKQNQVTEDETIANNSGGEDAANERSPIFSGGNYILFLPLKEETIEEDPDPCTCEYCGESFQSLLQFNEHKEKHHINNHHSEDSNSECVYNEQKSVAKGTILYQCEICGKGFKLRDSYLAHQRTHTGERPYVCHICGNSFVRSKGLKCHLKYVHLGVKEHTCDICSRTFAMKSSLVDHRRTHTGETPFTCNICRKSFKTKSSLNIHNKYHTDESCYACNYCQRRFRQNHHLLNHLTIHTGEKNHICDICGKQFQIKYDMIRHRKLHSGIKPFECSVCGLMFADKRYLTKHKRSHKETDTIDFNE